MVSGSGHSHFLNILWLAKVDAVGQTDIICTCREEPLINPLITQITFSGDVLLRLKDDSPERTGCYTGLTACAVFLIQNDNSIFSLGNRFYRTNFGTRGTLAVLADADTKNRI